MNVAQDSPTLLILWCRARHSGSDTPPPEELAALLVQLLFRFQVLSADANLCVGYCFFPPSLPRSDLCPNSRWGSFRSRSSESRRSYPRMVAVAVAQPAAVARVRNLCRKRLKHEECWGESRPKRQYCLLSTRPGRRHRHRDRHATVAAE